MRKNAVGENPRNVLALTGGAVGSRSAAAVATRPEPRTRAEPEAPRRKETFNLDVDIMRRTRNAVAHLESAPHWLCAGLSDFVEQAIQEKLERVEEEHNEGQPFPEPPRPLKRGPKGRQ